MADDLSETMDLLLRWHEGDRAALDELIARDLPWIEQHVRRRLGPALRARGDTQDYDDGSLDCHRLGRRRRATS